MTNSTNIEQDYQLNFIPNAHRIGTATLLIVMICCMLPGLYLSLIQGYFPGFEILLQVFIVIAAYAGVIWIIEPITYFPMLGVSGNYMSFLAGNIGNMRLPVAISCQEAVDAPLGSKKAEVASILGIGVSVVVNLIFLVILVVAGAFIMENLPQEAIDAILSYTPASIYAAVFVMFFNAAKSNKYRAIAIILGLICVFMPFDFFAQPYNVAYTGIAAIIVSLIVASLENQTPDSKE